MVCDAGLLTTACETATYHLPSAYLRGRNFSALLQKSKEGVCSGNGLINIAEEQSSSRPHQGYRRLEICFPESKWPAGMKIKALQQSDIDGRLLSSQFFCSAGISGTAAVPSPH